MDYQDSKINLVINKLSQEQFKEAQLSGLIDDTQLYMITDDKAVSADTRYNLINLIPHLDIVLVAGITLTALTCQVHDLAINTLSCNSNIYPLVVYMPNIPPAGGRDFCVRVECLSSAPSIAFLGSNNESCDFESTDDDWATLEIGANLFNFTETKR